MMRVIVSNANSLLYTDNGASGFWQWNRGDWSQIAATDPSSVVASGTYAYAKMADGLYEWNGYTWKRINTVNPTTMVASTSGLYADFAGTRTLSLERTLHGQKLMHPIQPTWWRLDPVCMRTSQDSDSTYWNGTAWTKINALHPTNMVASASILYADFAELRTLSMERQYMDKN